MTYPENWSLNDARAFVENKFMEVYPYSGKSGEIIFQLPDGSSMKVVQLGGDFNSLVLAYTEEDGDLYSPRDYETLDDMFAEMLKETKL